MSNHSIGTEAGYRLTLREAPTSDIWDTMVGHFYEHIDEANADLKKLGLQPLGSSSY